MKNLIWTGLFLLSQGLWAVNIRIEGDCAWEKSWEIKELLGEGKFGKVFRAKNGSGAKIN